MLHDTVTTGNTTAQLCSTFSESDKELDKAIVQRILSHNRTMPFLWYYLAQVCKKLFTPEQLTGPFPVGRIGHQPVRQYSQPGQG